MDKNYHNYYKHRLKALEEKIEKIEKENLELHNNNGKLGLYIINNLKKEEI